MASKCLRRSYVKSVLNNLSLRSNRSRAIHCGSNQILCAEHHDDSHKNAAKDQTEFRVYEIAGLKKEERKRKTRPQRAPVPPDRSKRLSPDDDWTSVWPARAMFKSSVINFPVRQGLIKSSEENEGVSPGRYANAELIKIPNFLHLTPAHIKAHCQAIKKFCTPWPKGLETDEKCEEHFPLEVIYSNYLSAGPSIRNPKARVLTAKIKISHLGLDYHARDKLARLAGDRYNKETEELVLTSDRCPMVKQNKDFIFYLLTALFYESRKTEAWEDEKTEADMECYYWDISQSRKTVISLINHMQQADNQPGKSDAASQSPEDIVQLKSVQDYKEATSALQNQGESRDNLDQYKQAVLQLFNIKQPSQDL